MVTHDGDVIVMTTAPPPRRLRVLFGVVGLALLGVGLAGLLAIARHLLWAPQDGASTPALALAIAITIAFLGVAGGLLHGALLPWQTLRLDPHDRRARLTLRRPVATTRRSFAFDALTPPRPVFTREDAESSASWSLAMRLPDGTRIDHCEVTLPLADQQRFAEVWCARIAAMIGGASDPTSSTSDHDRG